MERLPVKASELGKWTVVNDRRSGWGVLIEDGERSVVISTPTEADARIVAAGPRLLQLLQPSVARDNSPMWVDLDNVFSQCGISLEK